MNKNNKTEEQLPPARTYTIEGLPIPSCIKLPAGVKGMWIDFKDPSFPEFVQSLIEKLPKEQVMPLERGASGKLKPVGIPEVSELPNPIDYKGPSIVYLTADNKLYSYVNGAWELTMKEVAPGIVYDWSLVSELPDPNGYQGTYTVIVKADGQAFDYVDGAWKKNHRMSAKETTEQMVRRIVREEMKNLLK